MKRKYRRIATSFRRTFFNIILMGEKSTSFWHTFFDVISMGENLTLFWHTLFDVISMTKKSTLFWPWSYNRNGNNMYKNSFIKVYWIRYGFEVERDSLLTKIRNIVTRPPTCWKPGSCFWFVRKEKKRTKENL